MSDNNQNIEGLYLHANTGLGIKNNCGPKPSCDPCKRPKINMPSSKRCTSAIKVDPRKIIYQQPYDTQCVPQNVCENVGDPIDQNNFNVKGNTKGGFGQQQFPQQQFPQQQFPQQQFPQQQFPQQQYPTQGYNTQMYSPDQQQELESKKLSLTHPDNRTTLKTWAKFHGSLNQFEMNDPLTHQDLSSYKEISGLPDNVLLLDARIISIANDLPVDVGISIKGGSTNGMVLTPSGNQHYVAMRNNIEQHIQGHDGKGFRIHKPLKEEIGVIMENYGHMDPSSIEKGITDVQNMNGETSHCTVHKDHIVPKIIQMNKDILELGDEIYPIGDYYHIARPLVDTCVDQLRKNVFEKIGGSIFDMSNLVISIARADGKSWNDPNGISGVTNSTKDYALNEPNTITFLLEFTVSSTKNEED
jgi:hypothetical protein